MQYLPSLDHKIVVATKTTIRCLNIIDWQCALIYNYLQPSCPGGDISLIFWWNVCICGRVCVSWYLLRTTQHFQTPNMNKTSMYVFVDCQITNWLCSDLAAINKTASRAILSVAVNVSMILPTSRSYSLYSSVHTIGKGCSHREFTVRHLTLKDTMYSRVYQSRDLNLLWFVV